MASLGLGFGGQNIEDDDKPNPPLAGGTDQHFLMHCEIEGPGMHDLLILLGVMAAIFVAAAFAVAIPGIGPIVSWILIALALLAFLIGGPAISIHHRSEDHTSELQSHLNLVCRLLLEKKSQPGCPWRRARPARSPY